MHCDQFCQFSKNCHLLNIRCFFEAAFCQNNSNMLEDLFFTFFSEFQLLTQFNYFAKDIVHAL